MNVYGKVLLLCWLPLTGGMLLAEVFEQDSAAVHSDAEPILASIADSEGFDEIESSEGHNEHEAVAEQEPASFLKTEEVKKPVYLTVEQKKKPLVISSPNSIA